MLKATMIGHIGGDPETRYSASGNAFLRFTMASNFRRYDGDGSYTDATQWVRVTVAGKRAETLGQYLKKGMRVYVDGRLEARPWTNQQGEPQAGLEIFAAEVQFASSGDGDDERPAQREQRQQPERREPQPVGARRTPAAQQQRAREILGDDDPDDDDLPF